MDKIKRCPKCQTEKDVIEFNKGQGWCRVCQKTWRQANKEKIYELNKDYMDRNRERVNQWNRESYHRHWDEQIERNKKKYERDKDKLKPVRRAWAVANKPKIQAYWAKRRALKKNAVVNDLTPQQWIDIVEKCNHCCAYCGKSGIKLEQEHKIPLSRGGNHTAENIVPACLPCNRKKYIKTAEEYETQQQNL